MRISDIRTRKIFDSRGGPTIEVCLEDGKGLVFSAQIPSGKSRGAREAAVLSPENAKRVVDGFLRKKLRGRGFASVGRLDKLLLELDGTPRKTKLGGNLTLGASVAFARGLAFERKKKPWELLRGEFFGGKAPDRAPLVFSNFINGGAHAGNNLDLQEYLVVMKPSRPLAKSVEKLIEFYVKLGDFLKKKYRLPNVPVGDEGGYSLNFKNNFEPVRILESLASRLRPKGEFRLGLDAAASEFYKAGWYGFEGKRLSREELESAYKRYFRNSRRLFSLEDPFDENDEGGFAELAAAEKGRLIVGDDLTVTDAEAIDRFGRDGVINAVIIKPNQIGTVSEACRAINIAHKRGLKCIVSHRSGETADNFIIQLARAAGVYGVKIGAPRGERMLKFNELMSVYN